MKLGDLSKYYHTIKYLRPVQIVNRVKRLLLRGSRTTVNPELPQRALLRQLQPYLDKPASYLGNGLFSLLNRQVQVSARHDWNSSQLPKLWLYNLHYHDGLSSMETTAAIKGELIDRWIDENPVGHGNGWEPYPLSLRIVNWIKWFSGDGQPTRQQLVTLAQQVASLSQQIEYHLMGNHLFANAKALFFAGYFFEGPEAEKWLALGRKILATETSEQFLDDGGHFELSSTYHATLTEDLLDIINISQAYGVEIGQGVQDTAAQALSWLAVMTRPDGLPPLFNDAAYGISPTLAQLTAYGKRIGIQPEQHVADQLVDLPASGYFRFEGPNYSFWGDAGQIGPDYIPGHAHCDMLSFELYAHGKPIIVDTGISTYEVDERRHYERSTAAHNTVQIAAREQSEIWGAFRVARRARIIKREIESASVVAGYQMYGKPNATHERRFEFSDQTIRLYDRLDGKPAHFNTTARFHCHPDIQPRLEDNCVILGPVRLYFSNAKRISLVDYNYAPEFDKLMPAKSVEVEFNQTLNTEIRL